MPKYVWQIIIGISAILSVVTSVLAFDARYAKQSQVVQTMDEYNNKVQLQFLILRSNMLKDQEFQIRMALRDTPTDEFLKSELERVEREASELNKEIDKRMMEQ